MKAENSNKRINQKYIWWGIGLFALVSVVAVSISHPGFLTDHVHAIAYIFSFGN
jgi:hypothetical protein